MKARMNSVGGLGLVVGVAVMLGAGLGGCQSGARQADGFAMGGERNPTPRTLHMMAKLINENGRADQAEFVLSKIIEDSPTYLPAYVELSDLYIGRARYTQARDTLRLARRVAPNDAVIANNLGVLLLREAEFAEATEVFRVALSREPQEARYHANLAVSLAMQGAYKEAFDAWANVLPASEVFWNLGVVAEARGASSQANEFYASANRVRKGEPAVPIAPEFDVRFASESESEFGPIFEPGQMATVSVPVD